jgi:hypothetical protein
MQDIKMNYAKINSENIIIDVVVANEAPTFLEGTWVECPDWLGIGLNINDPEPEPLPQPIVDGAQTL